jgi:hypothetical protein
MAAVVLILVYFSFVVGMACLIWKFSRIPFPPEAAVLPTSEMEFPEEVRTDLRAVSEELAVLGFESADALRLDYGSLSTAFAVAFKGQGTTFAVYHFHTANRSSYVEFRTCSSRYEDLISIARYPTAIESAGPAAGLLLMVPPMPNYSLFAFHEAARARILGDQALPIPAELATHLFAFHNSRFQRVFNDKTMVLRNGTARFRWPHLLRFAALTLPPLRFIESARNRARVHRILAEVPTGKFNAIRSALALAERKQR